MGHAPSWTLMIALAVLGGCASLDGYPERVIDPDQDLQALQGELASSRIVQCLEKTDKAAKSCRDTIVTARKYAIDVKFSAFEEDLFRGTRTAGFLTTLASLGLTSGATLAAAPITQALSAAATGVTGARAAFDREILAEKTLLAIHTSMRGNRAAVGNRIALGLRRDVQTYPLLVALSDLDDYYYSGTVLGALTNINVQVGAEAKQAQDEVLTASGLAANPAAEWLRGYLGPPTSDGFAKRAAKIQEEMTRTGVETSWPVPFFVRADLPNLIAKQEAVAKALGWKPEEAGE